MKDFKGREMYSKNIVVPPFFLRVDGWNFSKVLSRIGFDKPYDERFARALVESAQRVMEMFSPTLSYVFSDEINFLFIKSPPFKGRHEKLVSLIPSIVSGEFVRRIRAKKDESIGFDAKCIIVHPEEIIDYLIWRQREAWRNHINSYSYWVLRKKGLSPREAQKHLNGLKSSELHELLRSEGINPTKTPEWQRRGILLHKIEVEIKSRVGHVKRKRIVQNWTPPLFNTQKGIELIKRLLREETG